jgi:hypothetical protein
MPATTVPTKDNPVTVNTEQELFAIKEGNGYSCLGFDVTIQRTNAVAVWLNRLDLRNTAERGTLESYAQYRRNMAEGARHAAEKRVRCPMELHPKLMGLEGARVMVTHPDGTTERFNVGKSTGWMPCHLRVHNTRSMGGAPVSAREEFTSVTVIRR